MIPSERILLYHFQMMRIALPSGLFLLCTALSSPALASAEAACADLSADAMPLLAELRGLEEEFPREVFVGPADADSVPTVLAARAEALAQRAQSRLPGEHPCLARFYNAATATLVRSDQRLAESYAVRAFTLMQRRTDLPMLRYETAFNLVGASARFGPPGPNQPLVEAAVTVRDAVDRDFGIDYAELRSAVGPLGLPRFLGQATGLLMLQSWAAMLGVAAAGYTAELYAAHSLDLIERVPANDPLRATLLHSHAVYVSDLAERAGDAEGMQRAAALFRNVLALPQPPQARAVTQDALAGLLIQLGEPAEALDLSRQALAGIGPERASLYRMRLANRQVIAADHRGARAMLAQAISGKRPPPGAARLELLLDALDGAPTLPLVERMGAAMRAEVDTTGGVPNAAYRQLAALLQNGREHRNAILAQLNAIKLTLNAAVERGGALQVRPDEWSSDIAEATGALVPMILALPKASQQATQVLEAVWRSKGRGQAMLVRAAERQPAQLAVLSHLARFVQTLVPGQVSQAQWQELHRLLANDLGTRVRPDRPEPPRFTEVQAHLPAEAALLEFVRYPAFDLTASWIGRGPSSPWRYAVAVVRRDGAPRWVDLGPAEDIDGAVRTLRGLTTERVVRMVPNATEKAVGVARALFEKVLAPLGPLPDLLLVSPDGMLHQIPWAALRPSTGGGPRLVASVISTLDFRPPVPPPATGPDVVLAAPAFTLPGGPPTDASAARWLPLPGTETEAHAIVPHLRQPRVLLGEDATKSALLGVRSPRILHVATHGFYQPDASSALRMLSSGLANPLLQSGLAVAGANAPGLDEAAGIVTSLEVSAMSLRGTQLVVLSACETDAGEVISGEGIFGLQRALRAAGAQSQLLALWPVDDAATAAFMATFHESLASGNGRAAAVQAAQLRIMAEPGWEHPWYWAGFTLSGAWGTMPE